jgi:hypothetical protein
VARVGLILGGVVAAGGLAWLLWPKSKNAGGGTMDEPGQDQAFDWESVVRAVGFQGEQSRDWATLNPNDRGNGVSFGLLQFNQAGGGLGRVMSRFRELDPEAWAAAWGGEAPATNVLRALTGSSRVQRMAVDLAHDPLRSRLLACGQAEACQQAQLDIAWTDYAAPLLQQAKNAALDQTAEFGVVFDRSINQGPGAAASGLVSALVAVNSGQGYPANLDAFINRMVALAASGDGPAIRARVERVYRALGGPVA